MKRVKSRKNFRISNPIGFSLFIAGCLLALGVIAVIVTLAIGYGGDMVRQVQASIQGTVEEINDQPTFTPEATPEATETPEPILTPEVGTPTPSDTPTPEPIGDINDTPVPTVDVTAPLYGKTIGLNPMRDSSAPHAREFSTLNSRRSSRNTSRIAARPSFSRAIRTRARFPPSSAD